MAAAPVRSLSRPVARPEDSAGPALSPGDVDMTGPRQRPGARCSHDHRHGPDRAPGDRARTSRPRRPPKRGRHHQADRLRRRVGGPPRGDLLLRRPRPPRLLDGLGPRHGHDRASSSASWPRSRPGTWSRTGWSWWRPPRASPTARPWWPPSRRPRWPTPFRVGAPSRSGSPTPCSASWGFSKSRTHRLPRRRRHLEQLREAGHAGAGPRPARLLRARPAGRGSSPGRSASPPWWRRWPSSPTSSTARTSPSGPACGRPGWPAPCAGCSTRARPRAGTWPRCASATASSASSGAPGSA